MKRLVLPILALSLALPSPAAQVMNRTLATVNGDPILQSDFEKTYAALSADLPESLPDDKKRENKKKLLQNLIDQKLILQEAKKRKMRIGQRELESGLIQVKLGFLPKPAQQEFQRIMDQQMAGKNQNDPNAEGPDLGAGWAALQKADPAAIKEVESQFQEELRKEGLDQKKYEDRIKDQILTNQLSQAEMHQRVKSPTEVQVKALFDKVTQTIAGKNVQDPEIGDDLADLSKYFAQQTGEKIHARHVLIAFSKDASFKDKSTALKKAQSLKKKIDGGEDFAEVAKENSDDKGSAQKGGDLGVVIRGQTVPAFEKAAFALPLGKVSEPVESPFGYHLILVEEKKASSKLRYDDVKDDLAQFLMNIQGRKALMGFVSELRAAASIKLNVDNLDDLGGNGK